VQDREVVPQEIRRLCNRFANINFPFGIRCGRVFAEFETNLRRERQLEGIAKAKAAGVYGAASRLLIRHKLRSSGLRGWVPLRSQSGWILAVRRFIGCWLL